MDQEDTRTRSGDMDWPALSADLNLARTAARTVTLDTHRASEDGRILEVSAQLELMRTRLSSLERHVFDAATDDGISSDVQERLTELDRELATSTSRFAELAKRVSATEEKAATALLTSVDGFDSRLSVVEDARLAQSNEVSEITGYLEQAFERLTELALLVEEERGANSAARAETFNKMAEYNSQVDASVGNLDLAIAALKTRLDDATKKIDAANDEVVTRLNHQVLAIEERLDATDAQMEARFGQSDEIATSIQFLSARSEALEEAQVKTANQIVDRIESTNSEVDKVKDVVQTQADLTAKNSGVAKANTAAISELDERLTQAESSEQSKNSVLQTHSEILEATTGLLAEQAGVIETTNDAVTNLSEELTEHGATLTETTGSLKNLEAELAEHDRLVQQTLSSAAATTEAAQLAADRAEAASQTTEVLSERIDLIDNATESLRAKGEELASTTEKVAAQTNATNEAIVQVVETVASNRDAVDELRGHAANTDSKLEDLDTRTGNTETRVQLLEDQVQSSTIEANAEQSSALQKIAGTSAEQAEAIQAIEHAHALFDGRIDDTNERLLGVSEQIDGFSGVVGEQLETFADLTVELTQHVGDIEGQVSKLDERLTELDADTSVDERLNDSTSQLDFAHNRINESVAQIDEIDARVAATEAQLSTSGAKLNTVAAQVNTVETQVSTVEAQVNTVETQVNTVEAQVNNVEAQVNTVETQVNTVEAQVAEAGNQIATAEQRIGVVDERVDQTNERLTQVEQHSTEQASQFEQSAQQISLFEGQVTELGKQVREQSEQHSSAHQGLVSDLDRVEREVNTRLDEIEKLADPEKHLAAVHESIAQAEQQAREANEFSENLRQLQAELVLTLDAGMKEQSEKLEAHAATLAEIDLDAEYASAERVHALETKIVEAISTISQLTQIQRRNTSVESQLTDTLTATSEGVEYTQRHVVALRTELEKALARIAQLEATVAGGGASRAGAPAVAPIQAVAPAPAPVATQVQEPTPAVVEPAPTDEAEDNVDTDWFNESYARRNAS